jgi:hypothetical protein
MARFTRLVLAVRPSRRPACVTGREMNIALVVLVRSYQCRRRWEDVPHATRPYRLRPAGVACRTPAKEGSR